MIRLTKKQLEDLGYECNSFHEAVFVSASRAAPLAHRACPICGCEGGLVTGTLRVHTSDGPHEVEHRCHIECVDWPTVPVGNRMDPTHGGACICDECLEARGRDLGSCPELADQDQHACWSCEEFMRAAEAEAYQQALERAMQAEADRIDQEQERLDDLARGSTPSQTAAQAEIDRLTIEQAKDLEADSLTE